MGAKNPLQVGSIDEALGLLPRFQGAESFIVSPVSDANGGGRPSWHVLLLNEDGDPCGWIKESEAEAEGKEDVAFRVPTVDLSAEDLPALPKSKTNLWQFCFCDSDGTKMEPRIVIDPSEDNERPIRRQRAETPKRPPESAPADSVPASGLPESALIRALEIQARSNERLMAQIHQLLATVTGSVDQLGKGHAHLGALLTDNLVRSEQRADKAEQLRDQTLLENDKLSAALADARQTGQGWLAFKEIYAGKPELLHDGLRDIAGGVVSALRTALTAAEKD